MVGVQVGIGLTFSRKAVAVVVVEVIDFWVDEAGDFLVDEEGNNLVF